MGNLRIGYCCINLILQKNEKITTNRGMKKATFQKKGIEYAGNLAEKNLLDLKKILLWNIRNNITIFRMSSEMFPWMSEYEISNLPNYEEILRICQDIGSIANDHGLRLSFHPGPFNVLASPTESVVTKTIKELDQHSQIMDMMNLSATKFNAINIHVNGVYGNKSTTFRRFMENFKKLNINTQRRLTVENDDKTGQWSTNDLWKFLHGYYAEKPAIVFDFHHHDCHPDGLDEGTALLMATTTWPSGIRPLCHMSSSKQIEVPESKKLAHADFIYSKINTHGHDIDVELEAKAKELALLDYYQKFKSMIQSFYLTSNPEIKISVKSIPFEKYKYLPPNQQNEETDNFYQEFVKQAEMKMNLTGLKLFCQREDEVWLSDGEENIYTFTFNPEK